MKNTIQDSESLRKQFLASQKVFNALGDETRMYLLLIMLEGPCDGSRVIDLAPKVNLSRPAVSHHLQILKQAGIVKTWKVKTCIYYYLEPQHCEIDKLINLFQHIKEIMNNVSRCEMEEE